MQNKNLKLERFLIKAYNKFGDLYDYSKVQYKNSKTSIKIICKIHGEFNISPNNFLNSSKCGCPKCGEALRGLNKRLGIKEFIRKSTIIHLEKYKYDLVDYKDTHTKVIIICPIHGEFLQSPANHLSGHGCPKCANIQIKEKQLMSQCDFLNKCIEIHGDKYDYSKVKYMGSYTPITIVCPKHGEFIQLPVVHLQGSGCVKCRLKNQTKLYNLIKEEFKNDDVEWEYSPEWLGRQKFDISLPKYNIAIEYNGRQHYMPIEKFGGVIGFNKTLERDILKRDKCKIYNWKIFDIKYDYSNYDYDNLINSIKFEIKTLYTVSYA